MKTPYLNLSIGAPARLAILKRDAIAHNAKPYISNKSATWREMRYGNLRAPSGLDSGLNDDSPIWYCHDGEQFRNERDVHDVVRTSHTGWYTDPDGYELAIGIVAGLPHGRFIAGYRLTMNDERVYFPELFIDAEEAAHMADEHARIIGEKESEYQERWRAAHDLQEEIDDKREALARALALRHSMKHGAWSRNAIADLFQELREARETMARDYSEIDL